MPIARQETGLNLSRLAEGEVDPIGRLPPEGLTAYKGTCHCGRNRFEVHLREAQITNALACNCSLCHKAGYLWAIPEAGDINYLKAGSKEKSLVADTVGLESYETEALRHQVCTWLRIGRATDHAQVSLCVVTGHVALHFRFWEEVHMYIIMLMKFLHEFVVLYFVWNRTVRHTQGWTSGESAWHKCETQPIRVAL